MQSLINHLPLIVLISMVVLFFVILGTLVSNKKQSDTPVLHKTMPNGISIVNEESTEEEDL